MQSWFDRPQPALVLAFKDSLDLLGQIKIGERRTAVTSAQVAPSVGENYILGNAWMA